MGSLPYVVEDCVGIVQIYSDGSIYRAEKIDFSMTLHDDGSAVWKDRLYDETHNLHLRLYRPRFPATTDDLPVVIFLHGGGFCVGSRNWPNFQTCCLRLAAALQAIVVAPDYRLSPEHRLPAAVEDSFAAVKWVKSQAISAAGGGGSSEEWLRDGVDFDRVFVIGDSSGGNLAHHLAVELRRDSPSLAPVRVRGYILVAPFFGGGVRTQSEVHGPPEPFLNVDILDSFWRLSLPVGATTDHPVANPFGPSSPNLELLNFGPIMVIVGGKEVMKDRVEDYYQRLKAMGKQIDYIVYQGEYHGFFVNDSYSQLSNEVLNELDDFIRRNSV